MNNVTDILRDRMQAPAGLQRMIVCSAAAHLALIGVLVLLPGVWWPVREPALRTVMTISLGGTAGPVNGGLTTIGGRAIQTARPLEAPRRPEPLRAPAAQTPAMTVPDQRARRPAPSAKVEQAPEDARGRTPSRGEAPRAGSAVAETGARGRGFGLSTGGGGAGGSGVQLDVPDFCCPEYITQMVEAIRGRWDARAEVPGMVTMVFKIQRDGRLTDIQVERSSRFQDLDFRAQRALVATGRLAPLPAAFPNDTLTVHLTFEYTR